MITIIDYGDGTSKLISDIFSDLQIENKITNLESEIGKADKIIFPGIGRAIFAAKKLHLLNLFTMLRLMKKPFLGIGLGMQLLCEKSKEGDVAGLGIIPVTVEKFNIDESLVPLPVMKNIDITKECNLLKGIEEKDTFEYCNKFYVPLNESTVAVSICDVKYSAVVQKSNFYGVQFHPETSGDCGIKLLKNFAEFCG